MRWDAVFKDLDDPWREAGEDLADEVAERSEIEQGRLLLTDRLAANRGAVLQVKMAGDRGEGAVEGTLLDSGPDWLLVDTTRGETVVALAVVLAIRGLTPANRPHGQAGVAESRLDLRFALRRLARVSGPVTVRLTDGTYKVGRLSRICADFVELNDPRAPEPLLLPTQAIAAVSSG